MKRDGYLQQPLAASARRTSTTSTTSPARLSIVADLTPDLENYTIATYSHSDTDGYGRADRAPAIAGDRLRLRRALPDQRHAVLRAARLRPDRPAERARRRLYDVENDNPNPSINLRPVAGDQHHDLEGQRHADDQEHRQLWRIPRDASSYSLDGDNFIVPTSGANARLQRPGVPRRRAVQHILLIRSQGDNAGAVDLHRGTAVPGHTADGRLNWQAGGYLEISSPLGFSAGYTGIFVNCTRSARTCSSAPTPLLVRRHAHPAIGRTKTELRQPRRFYAQATYKLTEQLSADRRHPLHLRTRSIGIAQSTRLTSSASPASAAVHHPAAAHRGCTGPPITPGKRTATDQQLRAHRFERKSNKPTWLIDLDYKPTARHAALCQVCARLSPGRRQPRPTSASRPGAGEGRHLRGRRQGQLPRRGAAATSTSPASTTTSPTSSSSPAASPIATGASGFSGAQRDRQRGQVAHLGHRGRCVGRRCSTACSFDARLCLSRHQAEDRDRSSRRSRPARPIRRLIPTARSSAGRSPLSPKNRVSLTGDLYAAARCETSARFRSAPPSCTPTRSSSIVPTIGLSRTLTERRGSCSSPPPTSRFGKSGLLPATNS